MPTISATQPHRTDQSITTVFLATAMAVVAVQALVLLAMGSPPICKCGYVRLWYGSAAGPETSQQISDWYSFTHVIHGLAFYFLLWFVAPRSSMGLRLVLAVGIEAGWEIIENTPLVIERYRQSALAQGYFGDSVLNSVCDAIAAIIGFLLAKRLPVAVSIALVVACEIFLAYMIRDNLLLNIIQLLWPSAALSQWQTGG